MDFVQILAWIASKLPWLLYGVLMLIGAAITFFSFFCLFRIVRHGVRFLFGKENEPSYWVSGGETFEEVFALIAFAILIVAAYNAHIWGKQYLAKTSDISIERIIK